MHILESVCKAYLITHGYVSDKILHTVFKDPETIAGGFYITPKHEMFTKIVFVSSHGIPCVFP